MATSVRSARVSRTRLAVLGGILAVVLAAPLASASATGAGPAWEDYGFQGEGEARVRDVDVRDGRVAPSAAQQAAVAGLDARARWNAFGTPHVLVRHGGYLSGPRDGDAADVARAFVAANAALFRLDAASVDALEVLRDSPLYDAPDLTRVYREGKPPKDADVAHVVMFRQTFDDLAAGLDGLLTVGVHRDGRVAWVSSSVTGDTQLQGDQRLSAAQAITAAADDVGLRLGRLTEVATPDDDFTTFDSERSPDVQRARLVALPTPEHGVRRAWEVTLLDTSLDAHGNPTAFISFVDAQTGAIWQRSNRVEHLADGLTAPMTAQVPSGERFSGTTPAGACGQPHEFDVGEGNGQISVGVQATSFEDDDVTLDLYYENTDGSPVAHQDVLTSPEVLVYTGPEGASGVPAGTYLVVVCPYNGASAPEINYEGMFAASAAPAAGVPQPSWRVFPANPPFVHDQHPDDVASDSDGYDNRVLWCWDNSANPAECAEQQRNIASRVPWDLNPQISLLSPTFTTDGNNASTAISEASFLTPDTAANRPVSPDRQYDYEWRNAWFEKSCEPSFGASDTITGAGDLNDESAAVANLFVMHNRMHDWSYFLGFTENNSNLQQSNFGNTAPSRETDPELGSAQAGRRSMMGRDNANQITLQDGIPGITNQYLWQPLAGAFYAPCVDGAYDMAVVAHEYGHAISNRMIGGPNTGTGGTQGQSESWSDLMFAAYFTEFGISAGEGVNPYVLGPYVTGDPTAGIRNYAMNDSPLNYTNLDYDGNGLGSPHANGEIWSAVNFDIMAALGEKYDAEFPVDDRERQEACARGEYAADACPGNRRWTQLMYDGLLLNPPNGTQIDSRDAMLAADMLRFDGANQSELWDAFSARGLGGSAYSEDVNDVESIGAFDSPVRDDEATVTFTAPAGAENLRVFVGHHEARTTPIADRDASTSADPEKHGDLEDQPFDPTASFVPGTYEFIARADGFGSHRFTLTLGPDQTRTFQVPLRRNLASKHSGATITGDGVNLDHLIDDTEATNWASLEHTEATQGNEDGQQVNGRQVTVELGAQPQWVREVQVSSVLRGPVDTDGQPDPGTQSRFSAMRSFDVLACDATAGTDCTAADHFTRIFQSPGDAFPAGRPRPRVPDLQIRAFDVTDTQATHVRMVVRHSQCTGAPAYKGENNPDNDPAFNPDCATSEMTPDRALLNPPRAQVRASELQVFSVASTGTTPPPGGGDGGNGGGDGGNGGNDGGGGGDGGGGDTGGGGNGGGGDVDDASGGGRDTGAPVLPATVAAPASDRALAATGLGLPYAVAAALLLLVTGAAVLVLQRRHAPAR